MSMGEPYFEDESTQRVLVPKSDLLIAGVPARTWTTDPASDYISSSWVGVTTNFDPTTSGEDPVAEMYGRALQACQADAYFDEA